MAVVTRRAKSGWTAEGPEDVVESVMLTTVVYQTPNTEPWRLSEEPDRLTYWKELAYVGKFVKAPPGAGRISFAVDEPQLWRWAQTYAQMLANGVRVPLPAEHTDDPEKNRGEILAMRVELNAKGKMSLFGKVRFRDAEAAKMANSADVSIFVPPYYTDGNGNTYDRPITHVALTTQPVIPGLEKFQAIAASLSAGDTRMPMNTLAQKLGIDPAGKDDATLEQELETLFTTMKTKLEELQGKPAEKPAASPAAMPVAAAQQPVPPAMAASFKRMLGENRAAKLDGLVSGGHITKAARDELAKEHCGEDALALSLTADGGDATFDRMVSALRLNQAVRLGEGTGPQTRNPDGTVALSQRTKAEDNPLLRDADKRAAAATK